MRRIIGGRQMNDVTISQKADVIQSVEMQTITEYLDTTGLTKQLLPKEKAMFVNMAKDYGLNPFKREIYCTVYGEGQNRQCSIITGYEVYLKRAERIGKLDGWNTTEMGNIKDGTFAVKVIIYRKDWSHPFEHTVYYAEVKQTKKDGSLNKFWATKPRFMTKKVAIAQAFRLCFPDEFGGMPYTNDEMGEDEIKEVEVKTVQDHNPIEVETKEVIDEQVTETQQSQEENNVIQDLAIQLENIVQEYRFELQGKPYKLATETLNKKDVNEKELTEMISRVITYLSKKGIKV